MILIDAAGFANCPAHTVFYSYVNDQIANNLQIMLSLRSDHLSFIKTTRNIEKLHYKTKVYNNDSTIKIVHLQFLCTRIYLDKFFYCKHRSITQICRQNLLKIIWIAQSLHVLE